ncbi:basic amino acid/polyamine antiporter [Enterococcus rivorum]|uniref:Arginine-ornithine antiporter n=1 Tax=Enterococcus rivorum TaxID=762845 RepID=A0A1E5KVS0_9ENTE|nr:basic amino acid/polyamine antiporter [Enterococcus rivorum]MBP2100417.1 arginine:ornithine antiporter/lysine permease [Enterococcus rivorum]OEH81719.1 arginine-ornithine antiporter [Enterococcus rivorum]
MDNSERKIGLLSLVGIIISAIVGAGIFNLMKEMASTASAGITIIGWIIAGIGMGSLAFCMENLNRKRPDLDSGIFSYAQEGFGNYIGFNSVWGYWISVIIGNVAFGTLLFSALGYFFPIFGDGQNVASIIGASIVLWLLHFMIIRGLDKATLLNTAVMIAKMIPIIIFIVCVIGAFNKDIFLNDFWGKVSDPNQYTNVFEQLKGTVLVTVWVFIGIEGAVVFSSRAKKRSDVGKATLLGFAAVTLIYATVTVFSYGVMSQQELKSLPNPAMAYVLEKIIGKPGAVIVNLGVIISIFGAWIANTLLAEEVAYQAGIKRLFPKIFTKENENSMPINSIIITNLIVQVLLLTFLVTNEAYSLLSKLSSSTILLPYTCVALFQMKLNLKSKEKALSKNMVVGIIATIYMLWLVYASGMMYVVLTILALCPGTIMYIYVKKKNSEKVFKPYEQVIFAFVILLFLYGIVKFPVIMSM